ncbi:MAG: ABC transporter permease [Phycisphaerales bacterium]|nr:ABC transporter permease [Phycisphaerales bacterium]
MAEAGMDTLMARRSSMGPGPGFSPTFLLPALSLARREVVRFLRQRARVVGALATPVLFWILLGSGIGRSFSVQGAENGGYMEYFFAGTLVMIVLFTAIFSTITLIEDRHEGFLQGVLVSPASRLSIVAGKILGSAILATGQAGLFLLLGPLSHVPLSLGGAAGCVFVLFLLSLGLSGMGLAVAWRMDSAHGYHSVMNLVMMPMWILSGAVFPASGASAWLRWVMWVNPLTYGMGLVRGVLHGSQAAGHAGSPPMALCWTVSVAFAAGMTLLCAWLATERSGGTA